MLTYDLAESDHLFSRLVERAAKGESLVINKNGKPFAKVVAIEPESGGVVTRIGFMKGQIEVPDDFDRMFGDEIVEIFEGGV